MNLLCKEINVAKSKEVKTGSDLAESYMESYGSKRAVLPIMMRAKKKLDCSKLYKML
jgi:hypothetical protein